MQHLIQIKERNGNQVVSARDLHGFLEVTERFASWFERQLQYDFEEMKDYIGCKTFNALAKQELQDYAITIDMAKEISMLQRSDKGKQARRYFIEVERNYRSKMMAIPQTLPEALRLAANQAEELQKKQQLLEEKDAKIASDAPRVAFAQAVETAKTSCLVGELAKILKANGVDMGQNRLFQWLRDNGYLCKQKGEMYNSPTQKSMDLGLFEIKKRTIGQPDGTIRTTSTSKVTGKGQTYFINKFLHNHLKKDS